MSTEQLRSVSLILLAIFFALYFYTDRQQDIHNSSARPAAERLLESISQWEKPVLLEQLAPEAKQTLSDDQLDQLLDHYRQYGELQSIDELEFSKLASALSLLGETKINYEGTATYSSGEVNINITLVPVGDGYKVYNFTISK